MDIARNVRTYLRDQNPVERPSSFDYCFNYFQDFRDRNATDELTSPEHLGLSCLHIGYYLASWGMLRGSTALHTKSFRFFEPTVEAIASEPLATWDIDVNTYTEDNISVLVGLRDRLATALTAKKSDGTDRIPTNTLLTKVMLGVFGSVPAFDTFFVRGFRSATKGVASFNRRSLSNLGGFYEQNAEAIDSCRMFTLDAVSGQPTSRLCTRAKVVDMVFLIEGGGS